MKGGARKAAGGGPAVSMIAQAALDPMTHARLWRNPCGFAARFNYIALRYNRPLYSWVAAEYGLTRPEYVVLYSLGLMDGATASQISVSSGFPRNTLSRAVNRLLKAGFLMRSVDSVDARVQRLFLAARGRRVLDETLPRFAATEKALLAPLSLVEREMLSMLMGKVALALFNDGEDAADRFGVED